MDILHDIKLYFSFFQAANDVIELIITELMADIWEQNDALWGKSFLSPDKCTQHMD